MDLAHELSGKRGETLVNRERGRRGTTVALAAGATGAFGSGMAVSLDVCS
jgi:hypothetical protein